MSTTPGLEGLLKELTWYKGMTARALLIAGVSMPLALAGMGFGAWTLTHQPEPKYFAADNGRLIPLIPLDRPSLDHAALVNWSVRVTGDALNLDFAHWRDDLMRVQDRFTPKGFAAFLNAMKSSGNLAAIQDKQLVATAVPNGAPVIVAEGVLNGQYSWRVKIPMLISYQGASAVSPQNVYVTLLVTRVPTTQTPEGVGVAQFVMSPK